MISNNEFTTYIERSEELISKLITMINLQYGKFDIEAENLEELDQILGDEYVNGLQKEAQWVLDRATYLKTWTPIIVFSPEDLAEEFCEVVLDGKNLIQEVEDLLTDEDISIVCKWLSGDGAYDHFWGSIREYIDIPEFKERILSELREQGLIDNEI